MRKINGYIYSELNERLQQLDELTHQIGVCLAAPTTNRVWPLIKQRRLVLMTDDPHIATSARFMKKQLCKHLNQQLNLRLNGVDIKVLTLPLASFGKKSRRKRITENTETTLQSIASGIDDAELAQALIDLSRHTTQ